ncbi:SUMO1 sentrin specific peptidase 1 [Desmophyllum pertusum]|uniref:SUMO1 sentrin specific peptidase 1 n=1 Tax=Desmophyllum pertusum TaxID=174260 RepID=A0A9X0DE00_9CNID|nr:SUMO1 sentrin specific peptidase 1 [Desmophyllum pertusum]
MIKHGMNALKQATTFLNPGQVPVIAFDQPLFALAKMRERLTEDFMMPDYLAEEHRECDHDPVEEITMPSLHETASMAVTYAMDNLPNNVISHSLYRVPVRKEALSFLVDNKKQLSDEGDLKVYTMNTFFYPTLLQGGYGGVLNWVEQVNLLEMDIISIPIYSPEHWSYAAIHLKKKTFIYYDSLKSTNLACVRNLRTYLYNYAFDKSGEQIDPDITCDKIGKIDIPNIRMWVTKILNISEDLVPKLKQTTEQNAMSEVDVSTINVCLRVLKEKNKSKYDAYFLRGVPLFDSVKRLKEYLLERCKDDMWPASDTTFRLGYYGEGHQKFSITSEVQLGEAMSLVKKGLVTLWVDPHFPMDDGRVSVSSGKREKVCEQTNPRSADDDEESGKSSYEERLSRLRANHTLPEFKLSCWAQMLVNGTHRSEEEPPDLPLFTGKAKGVKLTETEISGRASGQSVDDAAERKIRMRSAVLQQLRDLKALNGDGVLSDDEFLSQKEKLLKELSTL